MEFHDRVLKCIECGAEFIFTAGEQRFFAEKGFQHEPRRCKTCKGRTSPAGRSSSRSRQRTMTQTICSQCGKPTSVPFRPTQGRPVYCRDCYEQRRAAATHPPLP